MITYDYQGDEEKKKFQKVNRSVPKDLKTHMQDDFFSGTSS